jgi:hypothetical protein
VGLPNDDFLAKICGPKLKVGFPPSPKREGLPRAVRVTVLDGRGDTLFTDKFEAAPLLEGVADVASSSGSDAGPRRYQFVISVPDLDGATRLIVESRMSDFPQSRLS